MASVADHGMQGEGKGDNSLSGEKIYIYIRED